MRKKKIRQYVGQDKLREALDELAKGLPEEANLLRGRLTNKTSTGTGGRSAGRIIRLRGIS